MSDTRWPPRAHSRDVGAGQDSVDGGGERLLRSLWSRGMAELWNPTGGRHGNGGFGIELRPGQRGLACISHENSLTDSEGTLEGSSAIVLEGSCGPLRGRLSSSSAGRRRCPVPARWPTAGCARRQLVPQTAGREPGHGDEGCDEQLAQNAVRRAGPVVFEGIYELAHGAAAGRPWPRGRRWRPRPSRCRPVRAGGGGERCGASGGCTTLRPVSASSSCSGLKSIRRDHSPMRGSWALAFAGRTGGPPPLAQMCHCA